MSAVALGPVLVPLPRLYAFVAALLLLAASAGLLGLARREHARWFIGLVLAWLVGARLGHVGLNLDSYASAPLDALRFWQPGFHGLWGLLAALAWTGWALRHHLQRLACAMTMVFGLSVLWVALVALTPATIAPADNRLPDLTLENLDGETVDLPSLRGDVVLINLWATWCEPCRREMPLLAEAEARDGVTVAVINQGEDLLEVVRYLDAYEFEFAHALLDPDMQMMALARAPGLPTTLLFDADGQGVARHVGELTRAQLEAWLSRF